MKTVSIRDLHARTGAIVRQAAKRPLQITDRGRVLAVIQAPNVAAQQGVPLPEREDWIAKLPQQLSDSAALISDDSRPLMLYFDSNYILKCYLPEPRAHLVRALARQAVAKCCSTWGRIEVVDGTSSQAAGGQPHPRLAEGAVVPV